MAKEKKSQPPPDLTNLDRFKDKPFELLAELGRFMKGVKENFRPTDLAHSLQVLRGTIATLKEDTDMCERRYKDAAASWLSNQKETNAYKALQFELRQLIRTFFAEVDGTVYVARQVILWAFERGEVQLSNAELALTREESYRFDRKTKSADIRPSFLSTLDSFLLTFSLLPRLFKIEQQLNLSHHGWEAFQKLLEVRNTITHPKESTQLLVDSEIILRTLPAARAWYYVSLISLIPDPLLPDVLKRTPH
jgi:hypothetical protein